MYCNKLDFALIRFKIELKNVVVHVELLITNFKLMAAVDLTNTLNRSNNQILPARAHLFLRYHQYTMH